MISEIRPGIFTVDHQVAEGKNAIIIGESEAWAVDTGTHAAEGQEMADFIRELGYAPDRLIYTHGHGDHVLGSACFLGADVFAQRLTPVEMRRLLPCWPHGAARRRTSWRRRSPGRPSPSARNSGSTWAIGVFASFPRPATARTASPSTSRKRGCSLPAIRWSPASCRPSATATAWYWRHRCASWQRWRST